MNWKTKLRENIKGFIIALVLIPLTVYAAKKISSGNILLGTGVDEVHRITSNQSGANDPYLQFDNATGKWQFTNDGTVVKNLGSGDGGGSGGINELANAGFEDGFNVSWSNTGGTFSELTGAANVGFGEKAARLVATSSGEYFESDLATFSNIAKAQGGCMADFYYKSGADFKAVIYEGANVVTEQAIEVDATSAWAKFPTLVFDCYDSMKIRFESTAAGTIDVDNVYLGSNKNVGQVSIAQIAGQSYWPGTTNCQWEKSGATIGQMSTDVDCPGPTVEVENIGDWQTTDSDLPRQTINNLPAGSYKATFSFQAGSNAVSTLQAWAIHDGTTTCNPVGGNYAGGGSDAGDSAQVTMSCVFEYATAGNRDFEVYASAAANLAYLKNDITSPTYGTRFTLERFPLETQAAWTPDAAEFFISANIGGTSNIGLSTTSTPFLAQASTLDMVLNRGVARIACAGAASTGLTCSGNEAFGINFEMPISGRAKVCFEYTSRTNSNLSNGFRLAVTENNSDVILQEGKVYQGIVAANSGMHRHCEVFDLGAGERTVKLFYESLAGGNIYVDRDANEYNRDAHISVELVGHNVSRPILTGDQVSSPGSNRPVMYGCQIDGTTGVNPPVIANTGCDLWVSSVTESSGSYVVNFLPNTFAQIWSCTVLCAKSYGSDQCTAQINNNDITAGLTTSSISLGLLNNSNGGIVQDFAITCIGTKP